MGWGDEIIVTGQARVLQQKVNKPVVVFGRSLNIRQHEIWDNNPRITWKWDRVSATHHLRNGPGHRPYIAEKYESRWVWKDFQCPAGEIYFYPHELKFAEMYGGGFVVLEPNCKAKASPNKDWGRANWQRLADLMLGEGIRPVQLGDASASHRLVNVPLLHTPSFRHACAVLARSRAAVLPEGGLHHAAAALGVRAVVIYGGYISPRQTGYDLHRNLFTGGEPCGMRQPCKHCAKAMAAITPEEALENLLGILK